MRYVVCKGLNDDLNIEISRDVGVIVAIMEMEKSIAVNELIFKVVLTGEEFLEFIAKYKIDKVMPDQIVKENSYELTAYDWW